MAHAVFFTLFLTFTSEALCSAYKPPTVLASILVRNKQHTLPYFLSHFEALNYPKNRISLWIRSDHNLDQSIQILKTWIESVKDQYHSIFTEFHDGIQGFSDEQGSSEWSPNRFKHVMQLRDSSLDYARQKWADYYWSLDADVFLTNPDTLLYLISKNLPIVAPMLLSEGLYSNFWHGMSEEYYYLRTDGYKPILSRQNVSCFDVPMVHSCVLVDLRLAQSDSLTYRPEKLQAYPGPLDDIIVFALSAKLNNIPLHICNEEVFGYITVPLEQGEQLSHDLEHLLNVKLEVLNELGESLKVNNNLQQYITKPQKDTMGFDKIFMINLKRRPDRLRRMLQCFEELGLEVETVEAIDGQQLNDTVLQELKFMPDFKDPYHKRPMKLGEIGCFLSHYKIWKKTLENRYKKVLVLEDDIRFETYFRYRVETVMSEVLQLDTWDLVYFGRKRLQENDEPYLKGAQYLVEAGYSYWTLGYALSLSGANKLLDAQPLTKLVPVDEYLPILFDKHPRDNWKGYYPKRDLIALSAAPLLVYPTHYTGEKGYVSDTEDSLVIPETIIVKEDL